MENLLEKIDKVTLMGPGPSCVPDEVYRALAKPTLGHMDSQFIGIMDDIKAMLQTLLGTKNTLTLPISGTGSAGMETCMVNLIEHGDHVLILKNGVFGERNGQIHEPFAPIRMDWSPLRKERCLC